MTEGRGEVEARLLAVNREGGRGEPDMEREARAGLEDCEDRGVFQEEGGGSGGGGGGGQVEKGSRGEWEGEGGRGEDVAEERAERFEVFLLLDGSVEEWITNPFDSGIDE